MKKILLLIIICLPVFLTSCKEPKKEDTKKEDPKTEVTITEVSFTKADGIFEYSINEFLLENIKITIKYSDKTSKEVSLTKSMISEVDFETLLTSGFHTIEVTCEDTKLTAFIDITSTKTGQDRLPSVVLYDLVNENEGKYEDVYYTTGTDKFVSFQLQYLFDTDKVKDVELVKANGLTGSFISKVEDGIITITYSQSEQKKENVELFRIIYNSDQKYNNFTLDNNFKNGFFSFDKDVFEIKSVSYLTR